MNVDNFQQEENVEVNEKGFICCPKCGGKTKTKVRPDTELKNFPLYCTWCKEEIIIDHKEKARA